jgi:alkylation response protein AidB-like acyl-CoA dehydrogenase
MMALDGGRIGVAAQACGLSRAALSASTEYVRERSAFGKRVADFQAVQFQLANMATELRAAELLTLRAAGLKEAGRPFSQEASMAKLFASEAANRHCDRAVQLHGGYGYIDEFPVERYFRDARVTTIYEGTSEIQRIVIARALIKRS